MEKFAAQSSQRGRAVFLFEHKDYLPGYIFIDRRFIK